MRDCDGVVTDEQMERQGRGIENVVWRDLESEFDIVSVDVMSSTSFWLCIEMSKETDISFSVRAFIGTALDPVMCFLLGECEATVVFPLFAMVAWRDRRREPGDTRGKCRQME